MRKGLFILSIISASGYLYGGPILQMNKAFNSLTELVPFITEKSRFMEKKNEKLIASELKNIKDAFNQSKHETILKQDLFAPSYLLIKENLTSTLDAFNKGKKGYAHWRLKETTTLCLDCHTRLPEAHASSFQDGTLQIEQKRFSDQYNLGIAQLIVRKYSDAKATFTRVIEDRLLKGQHNELINPFKQIVLIHTKVQKDAEQIEVFLEHYINKKNFPTAEKEVLKTWSARLKKWKGNKYLKTIPSSDGEMTHFLNEVMSPLFKKDVYVGNYDIDLLYSYGILSNFLFENPTSKLTPEIVYWLGLTEKNLKRENYFGSGDLFLKQCIRRYSKHPIAKKCFAEYEESVEFDFTGTGGTFIPDDIQDELDELEKLLPKEIKK